MKIFGDKALFLLQAVDVTRDYTLNCDEPGNCSRDQIKSTLYLTHPPPRSIG